MRARPTPAVRARVHTHTHTRTHTHGRSSQRSGSRWTYRKCGMKALITPSLCRCVLHRVRACASMVRDHACARVCTHVYAHTHMHVHARAPAWRSGVCVCACASVYVRVQGRKHHAQTCRDQGYHSVWWVRFCDAHVSQKRVTKTCRKMRQKEREISVHRLNRGTCQKTSCASHGAALGEEEEEEEEEAGGAGGRRSRRRSRRSRIIGGAGGGGGGRIGWRWQALGARWHWLASGCLVSGCLGLRMLAWLQMPAIFTWLQMPAIFTWCRLLFCALPCPWLFRLLSFSGCRLSPRCCLPVSSRATPWASLRGGDCCGEGGRCGGGASGGGGGGGGRQGREEKGCCGGERATARMQDVACRSLLLGETVAARVAAACVCVCVCEGLSRWPECLSRSRCLWPIAGNATSYCRQCNTLVGEVTRGSEETRVSMHTHINAHTRTHTHGRTPTGAEACREAERRRPAWRPRQTFRSVLPSPTLSPTGPVPRGLLTLCPAASSGP